MYAEPSGEGGSAGGRLERWLDAVASEPSPEGEEGFGDDESIPGVSCPLEIIANKVLRKILLRFYASENVDKLGF